MITAAREVIGGALSTIFENHRLFVPQLDGLTHEKCTEILQRPKLCPQLQEWFDVELKPAIGVDVYSSLFPVSDGYATYSNRFARVLVYRFEKLPNLRPGA